MLRKKNSFDIIILKLYFYLNQIVGMLQLQRGLHLKPNIFFFSIKSILGKNMNKECTVFFKFMSHFEKHPIH